MLNQQSSQVKKLYRIPLNSKTNFISWFSVGALAFVVCSGGLILRESLQRQLDEQVSSQLSVADIQYNIKIDQMGFGFRGQSDNAAIIAATRDHKRGNKISADLRKQIKSILGNELTAREIEYATLVGNDRRIIVNANQERVGQLFDPNGLVTQAFKTGLQVKSSEIINWSEISQENPPLIEKLQQGDNLIRYTVTPVKDNQGKEIIGALISGDVVNEKSSIVVDSVRAFNDKDGYSAVYLKGSTGEFKLATSFLETEEEGIGTQISLSDQKILDKAIADVDGIAISQTEVNGNKYILAAKAITNSKNEAIGVIMYGTPASSSILNKSILAQVILALIAMVVTLWLTRLLTRAISEPIQELQQITQEFSEGTISARAKVYSHDEVGLLASTFNGLADSIEMSKEQLNNEVKRSHILKEIALNAGESSDKESIFQIMVDSARKAVDCDRVIYCKFDDGLDGTVIAESLDEHLNSALGSEIQQSYLIENSPEDYQQEMIKVVSDLESSGLSDAEIGYLGSLSIQSYVVIPVFEGDELSGLLIVCQCNQARTWDENDTSILEQIAQQSGTSLEKFDLLQKQKLVQIKERKARENLQQRALELLMEVDPVSRGDLTIRAQVKEDEIGTIADSYNATIESLRKLVNQVKTSASLVSTTTSEKETSIQELSQGASEQTKEIGAAIERINLMATSIKAVAANAEEAEDAVRQATETVKAGDQAMDRTVEGFKAIRETVAETAKKVKRLGESSQKISKVVNLISSFADQTNLLALNASIEAAHAGEEGRGFAVVADEVRSLARQSAEATADIESLVAEIQSETNEVVAAMESGTEQVVAGTKLVDETRSSLTQIADVSAQIDALVRAIAEATVEQSQDSEIVSKTMTQVASISHKTATEAEEVSVSFKELLMVAQILQESVAKFKVN